MSDEQTTTVLVEKVTSKEGATNGTPWRKWSIKDGNGAFYSTFRGGDVLGSSPMDWEGREAVVTWKPSGKEGQFKDLLHIEAIPENPISARTEEGTADWDLIGLRKTRCLLWAQYLEAVARGLPMSMFQAVDGAVLDGIYKTGVRLIACAERDIYHRPPASDTEDVPFVYMEPTEPGVHLDPWRPR